MKDLSLEKMLFVLSPSVTVSHLHPSYLREELPLLPLPPSQLFYLFHKEREKNKSIRVKKLKLVVYN